MIQYIKNITILFFLLLSLSVSACSKDDFTPAYPKSYLTGVYMRKPIGKKIWKITDGEEKIEYKLKGES